MLIEAKCKCGNEDVSKFVEYDGCLGYEAVVCLKCGRYSDHKNEYEADDFSKSIILNKRGIYAS